MTSANPSTSNTNTFNPQVNWVPTFNGENYEQWSIQMKSIFITQDIWDIIKDGYEKPKDANEEASWDETKKGLYKQNLRRDNFALSIIYRGVDETILPTIMAATTAKEAWSILETKYRGSEKFPDELLKDSIIVVRALREKLRALRKCDDANGGESLVEGKKDVGLYVMADTTFGSCCVDEVGAAHINAECVVHYGHTCLSPTSSLPAFFVFGKASLDIADCATRICNFASNCNKRVLVLLGLEYAHTMHDLREALADEAPKFSTSSSKLDISCADVMSSAVAPPKGQAEVVDNLSDCCEDGNAEVHKSYSIGGLTWSLPHDQQIEDYLLFWIGPDNSAFANVVLTYNACEIVRYDPAEKCLITDFSQITRILKRRYYLVEKAKDANIVGIVVGTLGVAGYLRMIHQMKDLVTKAGKKVYTLVVGRPNPAKLANFPECDVFVYVSCAQTALMDSKEFLAPIITPFEAMLAFSRGSQWTGAYTMEFRDLMKLPSFGVENGTDEPRFSLIQGGYVEEIDHEEIAADDNEGSRALAVATEKALRLRDEDVNGLVKIAPKSGAEFLAMRSYQGLDINHDGSMPKPVLTGKTGRAAGYEHEKSQEQHT